jgi:hypothetical protein
MKIKTHAASSSIFAKVINDLIIKDSKTDKSYVCILLSLSSNSDKSLLPTVRVNNDIRQYLCLSPTKGSINNLSCSNQNIENANHYYIKFNINNINDSLVDEVLFKLACNLGLKYKCEWCSYIYRGNSKNIQLHY